MTSPDLTTMVSTTVHQVSETDLVKAATAAIRLRVPDWRPREGNLEVMLIEAAAVLAGQTVYAVNQLPEVVLGGLLAINGVVRKPATPAWGQIAVLASSSIPEERTLPAGTIMRATTGPGESFDFVLQSNLTFYPGSGLVQYGEGRAVIPGTAPNGLPSGTVLELLTPVSWVETAMLTTAVNPGTAVETWPEFLARGAALLRRHSTTLVTADHFTAAALDVPGVVRAKVLNLFNPETSYVPGDAPGHLTVAVCGADGEALPEEISTQLLQYLTANALAGLVIHVIAPNLVGLNVTVNIQVKPGFEGGTVADRVEAALTAYLAPTRWPFANTVHVNNLIGVAAGVPGVELVVSTNPATDVVLSSTFAVLVNPTVTVNVV